MRSLALIVQKLWAKSRKNMTPLFWPKNQISLTSLKRDNRDVQFFLQFYLWLFFSILFERGLKVRFHLLEVLLSQNFLWLSYQQVFSLLFCRRNGGNRSLTNYFFSLNLWCFWLNQFWGFGRISVRFMMGRPDQV